MSELYPHDKPRKDVICPVCGEQGFDMKVPRTVDKKSMTLLTCHNCGTDFAVNMPTNKAS
jgi:transcription elongation factor Elf1